MPVIAPADETLAMVSAPDPEIVVPDIAPEDDRDETVTVVAPMVVQTSPPDDESDVPVIAPDEESEEQ